VSGLARSGPESGVKVEQDADTPQAINPANLAGTLPVAAQPVTSPPAVTTVPTAKAMLFRLHEFATASRPDKL